MCTKNQILEVYCKESSIPIGHQQISGIQAASFQGVCILHLFSEKEHHSWNSWKGSLRSFFAFANGSSLFAKPFITMPHLEKKTENICDTISFNTRKNWIREISAVILFCNIMGPETSTSLSVSY